MKLKCSNRWKIRDGLETLAIRDEGGQGDEKEDKKKEDQEMDEMEEKDEKEKQIKEKEKAVLNYCIIATYLFRSVLK